MSLGYNEVEVAWKEYTSDGSPVCSRCGNIIPKGDKYWVRTGMEGDPSIIGDDCLTTVKSN